MYKAFIFDMDGVIINSEYLWEKKEKVFLVKLMGKKIYQKIKEEILGSTTDVIYDLACQNGLKIDKDEFLKQYDDQAVLVYAQSKLTKDIDELLDYLVSLNFKIGLVTASRKLWIEQALSKLKNKDAFKYILSLAGKKDLKPKPYPDGYLEALKQLNSSPKETIILEDSSKGIAAAKKSGAFTICLPENLPYGFQPKGADMYVKNLQELIKFLKEPVK